MSQEDKLSKKISFATSFKPLKPSYKDCSNTIVKDYKEIMTEAGRPVLVETGSHSIVSLLNACKYDNDIYSLLSRYTSGDTTALNGAANRVFYGDITAIDKDLNTLNAERLAMFRQLSSDQLFSSFYSSNRSKFNSFDELLDSYQKTVQKMKADIDKKKGDNNG